MVENIQYQVKAFASEPVHTICPPAQLRAKHTWCTSCLRVEVYLLCIDHDVYRTWHLGWTIGTSHVSLGHKRSINIVKAAIVFLASHVSRRHSYRGYTHLRLCLTVRMMGARYVCVGISRAFGRLSR